MSLKLWLPLNGDLHNQGTFNTEIINGGATVNTNGKIGQCYFFNGGSVIRTDKALFDNLTQEFSYACWMKLNSTAIGCLFSNRNTSNANGITLFVNAASGAKIYFDAGNARWEKTYSFSTGQWYHIAFTYKAGDKKYIYVNGQLIDSISTSSLTMANAAATYSFIGGSQSTATSTNANYINAYLNDIRIYDHCLSAAEIKEISQGLILHYKLSGSNPNLLLNSAPHLNATTSWTARSGSVLSIQENSFGPYGYVIRSTKDTANPGIHHQPQNYALLENGETYTFSGWARASEPVNANFYNEYMSNTHTIALTTNWKFYSFTSVIDTSKTYHSDICYVTSAIDWVEACQWKLEKSNGPTEWIPHTSDTIYNIFSDKATKVEDSSGYNHNGTIIGSPIFSSGNGHYNSYINFPNNTSHIQCGVIATSGFTNSYTFAWWGTKSSADTMFWGFQDNIRLNGLYKNNLWNTGDSSNNPIYNIGTTTTITAPTVANWHHYAMTGNGTKCYLYVDGQLYGEAKTYKSINGTQLWINGWQNSTTYAGYMNMSDFRVYATALDADAIRQLYEIGAKADNKHNFHSFELNENGANKITKTGQLQCSAFSEFEGMSYLKYDPNLYIEPDGSCWVHIFHHNNPGSNLFSSTDTFVSSAYHSVNAWFNIELCDHLNTWEFLVDCKETTDSEVKRYRWIQNANPMVAAAADVAPAQVTYITDGYNTRSFGGIFKTVNSSAKTYTYLNTHDGDAAHFYGAFGQFKVWNSGITGQVATGSAHAITTGYVDLYVRIDNVTFTSPTIKSTKNNIWTGKQIIEL